MKQKVFAMMVGFTMTGLLGLPLSANAKEKKTYQQGMNSCTAWCDAHNRKPSSVRVCYSRCDTYWAKNGSDMPTPVESLSTSLEELSTAEDVLNPGP